jgi:hypothetical protein
MATSPNYGWLEPDNTDLVKNGALAIRTLGNAIDTTMATMTPKSLVDAKGDLIAATANDTPARLAVGNNGETLVADSSTSTGLRYQGSQAAGKNAVINGAFDIWQRGTSGTIAAGSYVAADRWYTYRNTTGSTFSRQSASLTSFQYSGRIARDSGNTATANISCGQSIESINSIPFAGQTVVFSFWAKAGANFSATSSILRARLLSSTTTDQNIVLNGGTTVIDQNVTLTTSWQRFSYTAAVGSTAVTLGTIFSYDPTGTAGAADNFEITGVQLELGSVATSFTRAGGTIQGELAACQRYFNGNTMDTTTTGQIPLAFGIQTNATNGNLMYTYPVPMRVKPTITITGLEATDLTGWAVAGTLGSTAAALQSARLAITFASNGAQYRPVFLMFPNTFTTAFIRLDSEL